MLCFYYLRQATFTEFEDATCKNTFRLCQAVCFSNQVWWCIPRTLALEAEAVQSPHLLSKVNLAYILNARPARATWYDLLSQNNRKRRGRRRKVV